MFIPPHCPNLECRHHRNPDHAGWYRKISPYATRTFGIVPRFLCKSCRRSFSRQTFSIHYYAKKLLDLSYIYHQINAGAGIRNISRDLQVSPRTVSNRIARLARNAILIHQQLVDHLPFAEDFVADGFESFCVSQYFPDNYTLLVGKDSQFVYDVHYATLRRKGRMREDQKRRRARLEKRFRPARGAIETSFRHLMRSLARGTEARLHPLILYTDEKKEYGRSLWKDPVSRRHLFEGRWRHHTVNSQLGRNRQNPLFAVNYMDREIRKDMASHARESVQFARNVNEAMLRMHLYLFDHNCRKPFRIGRSERRRHAEVAGLERRELDRMIRGFFERRFFAHGGRLEGHSGETTLNRRWVTPLKEGQEVVRKHLAA